ncbi:MAG: MBL fold metallo-hydrolase [Lachnospiraceae bacterium]|nr:MBL fold metallo-hydrolase [Lachnospiraceae bacterium]MCI1726942.1 MBL fold metallo-hydrolase [Lachnospiraceae bacterium]
MYTKLHPMVQFKKDTWEIDEFDVASCFLLIGREKAMLIDCGMGIGDLKGAVEQITDKPLIVVISHADPDHTGNARQFKEIWIHPLEAARSRIPCSLEMRKRDTRFIWLRNYPRIYPYDIETDLREPEEPMPEMHDLSDGQQFDLGGGRIVTAFFCPGHAPGEMIFLDEATRTLFCGDALNYNLHLGGTTIETALPYLERMRDLGERYDDIFNGHHDGRPFGAPLGKDCLPNAIELCHQLLENRYSLVQVPSSWGPWSGHKDSMCVLKGKNMLGVHEDRIFNSNNQEKEK